MKVFEPITLRGVELKNRIVMLAMHIDNIYVQDRRARAFYVERARGGVGAIVTQSTPVDWFWSDEPWGRPRGVQAFIEELQLLTEMVHEAGSKVGIQLWHSNRLPGGLADATVGEPVAPSSEEEISYQGPRSGIGPKVACRALTVDEIKLIVNKFAKAAAGARQAGFDFIEMNAAHGHLSSQFFSPAANRRTDAYGGTVQKRMRYGLECVSEMRAATGKDFSIIFRIGAYDDKPGGTTLEDNIAYARALEDVGVDAFDVSVGTPVDPARYHVDYLCPLPDRPMGTFINTAEAFKRNVHVPVLALGRINSLEVAESVLSQGKADLIGIGRQLIADPYYPEKIRTGRKQDVVPCLSCNTCLRSIPLMELRCSVNAAAGKEEESKIVPTEIPKKVLVIGGGPAGMEAARVAALRGHQVTLWEKNSKLGGQLVQASAAPYKEPVGEFAGYLAQQLEKVGVQVKLGQTATVASVRQAKPDAVVVAAGALPVTPDIPGLKGRNVLTFEQVLSGSKAPGQNVIVVGGGLVGLETAEFLVARSKKVTVVEMLTEIGCDAGVFRVPLMERLAKAGVRMETGAKVIAIDESGVQATRNGKAESFAADTVVLAMGLTANGELAKALQGQVPEVRAIGDCAEPKRIVDAVFAGFRAGLAV